MSVWKVVIQNAYLNQIKNLLRGNVLFATKMPFYAVAKGRTTGVFMTWADCEAQVKGFSGARYKKFDSVTDAQNFVTVEGGNNAPSKPIQNKVHSTTNKLKRPIPTQKVEKNTKKSKKKPKSVSEEESDSSNSLELSDDLDTILNKQMDDIEARLKGFEKGVDKIIKNSMKGKQTILIDPPETKKNRKSSSKEFQMDNEGFVEVYTDGACSANGRSGARAGLGVYWGEEHPLNVSEPVSGRATNNCGEIQAATKAIKQALDNGLTKLSINTDSKFLINSVTKWMPGWKRKGWKLQSGEPVKNEIDFKDLDSVQHKLQVKWNYVEAHRGVHGNEMADQLAKAGAAMYNK